MIPGTPAARCFILLQRLLPQHTLSRLIHALARVRWRALKNGLIGAFVRGFKPVMADARQPDPFAYESFNAFFTRELAAGARPMPPDALSVASPVDGTISQIGYLDGQSILQAKGRHFSLGALLGATPEQTMAFAGGAFATLYLGAVQLPSHPYAAGRAAAPHTAYSRQALQCECRDGSGRGRTVRAQ